MCIGTPSNQLAIRLVSGKLEMSGIRIRVHLAGAQAGSAGGSDTKTGGRGLDRTMLTWLMAESISGHCTVTRRITEIDCSRVQQSFAVIYQSRSASRQSVRGLATGADRRSH